jgi:hypothetical protein
VQNWKCLVVFITLVTKVYRSSTLINVKRATKHFKDRYLSVPWNTNVLQNSHGHDDLLVEDDVLCGYLLCPHCRSFSASARGTCARAISLHRPGGLVRVSCCNTTSSCIGCSRMDTCVHQDTPYKIASVACVDISAQAATTSVPRSHRAPCMYFCGGCGDISVSNCVSMG